MFTRTSNARLGEIHPELARRIRQLDEMVPSLSIQVVQGLRTWAQQEALYAQGRTTAGPGAAQVPGEGSLGKIVSNAPAGWSWHNFGLAVDVVPEDILPGQPDWDLNHPAWRKLVAAGESLGLVAAPSGKPSRTTRISN